MPSMITRKISHILILMTGLLILTPPAAADTADVYLAFSWSNTAHQDTLIVSESGWTICYLWLRDVTPNPLTLTEVQGWILWSDASQIPVARFVYNDSQNEIELSEQGSQRIEISTAYSALPSPDLLDFSPGFSTLCDEFNPRDRPQPRPSGPDQATRPLPSPG